MRFSAAIVALTIASPALATFCLLGLPDPFFPCPDKTTPTVPAVAVPTVPDTPKPATPEAAKPVNTQPADNDSNDDKPDAPKAVTTPESKPTTSAKDTTTTLISVSVIPVKPVTTSGVHSASSNATLPATKPASATATVAQYTPGPNAADTTSSSLGFVFAVMAMVGGMMA